MLTTLVISCCLVFIFLQLTNPYISLAKNAIKHTTTETYLISYRLANIHNIIKTISLAAYANAKYGLLLKVRYTARKLVVTDIVLRTLGKLDCVLMCLLWCDMLVLMVAVYEVLISSAPSLAPQLLGGLHFVLYCIWFAYYICKWLDGDK